MSDDEPKWPRATVIGVERHPINWAGMPRWREAVCDVCGHRQWEYGDQEHVLGLLRQEGWRMARPSQFEPPEAPDACPQCANRDG